jgi:hypothetical protein
MITRIERSRHLDLDRTVDQVSTGEAGGSLARLVTTCTVGTYPTTAGAFYAANPTEINGPEVEGGGATYVQDAFQVMYCLNLGTQIPPNGTRVIAESVGGRWVFRYDG